MLKEFTYDPQPYGARVIAVETVEPLQAPEQRTESNEYKFNRADKGWVRLTGTILRGKEVSRLFHATAYRDLTGNSITLEVPAEAYERGSYVTAYC